MAARDLISREAAVREALRIYRDARETVRKCREAEDDFGTLAFEGQMEAFRWMVMVLMVLPAAGKDEADKEQNEPLTIEQLREMDGEPVWFDNMCGGRWCIVYADYHCLAGKVFGITFGDAERTGITYRRPPDRQEDA